MTFGTAFVLIAISIGVHLEPDLSRFETASIQPIPVGLDLPTLGQRITPGSTTLFLEEKLINAHLAKSIRGQQVGPEQGVISIERVAVDLTENGFELLIERRIFKNQVSAQTASFGLSRNANGELVLKPTGGSYGKIPVPAAFALPMRPSLEKLVPVLKPEIDTFILPAKKFEFEDGRVSLTY